MSLSTVIHVLDLSVQYPGASMPPGMRGMHPQQYFVSWGRNILYPPKFVIVVVIIVRLNLTKLMHAGVQALSARALT